MEAEKGVRSWQQPMDTECYRLSKYVTGVRNGQERLKKLPKIV
jgi:hypothetical protein